MRKRYGKVAAVRGLDLECRDGDLTVLVGPSGSGKTTAIRLAAGLEFQDAGRIEIAGRDVTRVRPADRRVAMVFQSFALFPHLSVQRNIGFGLAVRGTPKAEVARRTFEAATVVGCERLLQRMPHELSGGEQQRVAVARALAAKPRAVLLDEPLVALDAVTAAEIRTMLREALDGVTAVAVTHDAVDAAALADRLLIVEEGRATQLGPVREVLATPATDVAARIAGLERVVGVASRGEWESRGWHLSSVVPFAGADGSALAAVFRAADVRIGDGPSGWDAIVRHLEPTATGVRVVADRGAAEIPVLAAAGLTPGDAVRFFVAPEHVRLVAVEPTVR